MVETIEITSTFKAWDTFCWPWFFTKNVGDRQLNGQFSRGKIWGCYYPLEFKGCFPQDVQTRPCKRRDSSFASIVLSPYFQSGFHLNPPPLIPKPSSAFLTHFKALICRKSPMRGRLKCEYAPLYASSNMPAKKILPQLFHPSSGSWNTSTAPELFSPIRWTDKQIIHCGICRVKYIQNPVSADIIQDIDIVCESFYS